jgi:hypothetical protein
VGTQEHLPEAEKCFVAFAKPGEDGSLVMASCQVGHQYQYELIGFVDWIRRFVVASGQDDDGEEGE